MKKAVFLSWVAVLALAVTARGAQHADLLKKLERFNVRLETAHYALGGTVAQERLVQYGQALEAIHAEFERGFENLLKEGGETAAPSTADRREPSRRIIPQRDVRRRAPAPRAPSTASQTEPGAERIRVILFKEPGEYAAFGDAFLKSSEHTQGVYLEAADTMVVVDRAEDTYGTLFHEAFHQFLRKHVVQPPMWLNEGLATGFGDGRPAGGGIRFDPVPERWDLVKRLNGDRRAIPLAVLVKADRKAFYNIEPVDVPGYRDVTVRSVFYAEAFAFTQFLLSQPDTLNRLRAYIRDLASSPSADRNAITEKHFPPEALAKLEPLWHRYVEKQ